MSKDYWLNETIEQTLDTVNFAMAIDESLSFRKTRDCMSIKEVYDARKIIITGCGDSWLAGIAMKPAMEALTGVEVEVMRNIEFSRYYPAEKLSANPNSPLVIGISISGSVSRVIEAIERAAHYGANTLAITNNPDGALAQAANRVLTLDMPPTTHTPGIASYIASTSALFQFALRVACVKGYVGMGETDIYRKALVKFYQSFTDVLPALDKRMYELSKTWKDYKAYDFVGDNADYATAFFGSAKFIEAFGGVCTYDDSEDWNHINFFLREPEKIGTVVIANSETPSFDRIKATIATMRKIGRPVLVITDADASEFADGCEVVTLPNCEYGYMKPIMQHLPLDFLCGHLMTQMGTTPYRGDEELYSETPPGARIKNSPIRIV